MKVLMVPSTMLPFPPVKGGAVQNLIKTYVEYNESTGNHQLSILSVYDKDAAVASQKWRYCDVHFIRVPSVLFRLRDSNNRLLTRIGFKTIHQFYLRKVVKLVKKKYCDYDKIILDNTPQFAIDVAAAYKNNVCIHIYNDYLNSQTQDIDKILSVTSEVITVSDFISNCVLSTGLIQRKKVITLHNGVELSKFGTDKSKSMRHHLRSELGIGDDDFVFIFVARLVPEKGIRELINAFNGIADMHVHLVVVGNKLYSGDITDPFLLELKSLAEANKNRIHFTGYVDYEILPDYYSMADVGVLPSLYEEPFALAAIEYMASGLAVILSDAGGFPEMAEGDAAIVVKRGSDFVSDLQEKMTLLVNDRKLCGQYAERGFIKSREFSSRLYCEGLESIISSNNEG